MSLTRSPFDLHELENLSKTLIKYISLYSAKKESCLQKLGQEEKIMRTKINDFSASTDKPKRDFDQFISSNNRNQNYFPRLKHEPRLKSHFKEDEDQNFSKNLSIPEQPRSDRPIRPSRRKWNPSPQSQSDALDVGMEEEAGGEQEDKNLDLRALRSEETLEFCRKPKTPNGKFGNNRLDEIHESGRAVAEPKVHLLRWRVERTRRVAGAEHQNVRVEGLQGHVDRPGTNLFEQKRGATQL